MISARIRKRFPGGPDAAPFTLDVDFKAATGITVLFGPSGAGKTLILDCIAGFLRPDEGRILLDDALLFDGPTGVHLPPQARNCGYVFQNYALFPHMSLRKNLEFAANRIPRLERHRKVSEMLERFHLAEVAGRRPHELSGGQKQRCSIARALIGSPKSLLLDEPARGLDAPLRNDLYGVLRDVRNDFRIPILLVTHDLAECFELGEEMLVMREGAIVQSGAPRKVLEQPANVDVARLLGLLNILPAEIKALDPARKTSRLKLDEFELTGPYFPGRLIGDRVSVYVQPDAVIAAARDGKPGPNQVVAQLERVVERAAGVRLEFSGGICAEMPRAEYERQRQNKEWVIEFPADALKVL
jgi:ABC-type sulfate/molybdate transport systems ATPase subunit